MLSLKIEKDAERRKRQLEALELMMREDEQRNDSKSLNIHRNAYECLLNQRIGEQINLTDKGSVRNDGMEG